ncbi:MAG TPA: hypothetical protein VED41_10260 [Solirubrobacteraceae bacterium]|nr:hypothetical protein [Solirubrobacteraceae bacterium]
MAKTHQVLIASLLICALLTGCAGTSGRTPTTASGPPPYVAEGNSICAAQLAPLRRLARPTTPEQAIAYLPSTLKVFRREVASLRKLDPPGAAHRQLAAALAGTDRLTALMARVLHELRAGTVEFSKLVDDRRRSVAMRAQLAAHFRQAGLTRCAQVGA